ncbi:PilN domain-containing protein [Halomonas sp. WWR20]
MTIDINLLPWREAQREHRSRRFQHALLVLAVLGLLGGWAMSQWYQLRVDAEQQRLALISQHTQQLDKDIQAVRDYQRLRERMLEQIKLIRELQFSRPQTVRVFNQLAENLVDGVRYERLSRQGELLSLSGQAHSNRQVSDQMRALASSAVFGVPVLSDVQSGEGPVKRFNMSVEQRLPGVPGPQEVSP